MHVLGRSIIQRLMHAVVVVKRKIISQPVTRFRDIAVVFEVNLFVLYGAPQALHEDIVEGPSAPVHAQAHLSRQERRLELRTGELHPLSGVEDFGTLSRQGPLQQQDPRTQFREWKQRLGSHSTTISSVAYSFVTRSRVELIA